MKYTMHSDKYMYIYCDKKHNIIFTVLTIFKSVVV